MPGDRVYVPAGLPHAIGEGILLVELQEPADLSVLLEYDGFQLDGPRDGHLGLGFDVALRCLDRDRAGRPGARAPEARRRRPARDAPGRDDAASARGGRASSAPSGSARDPAAALEPGFSILVAVAGRGRLETEQGGEVELARGDTVLVPYAAGARRAHRRDRRAALSTPEPGGVTMAVTEDRHRRPGPAVSSRGSNSRRDRILGALGRSWLFFFLLGLVGFFWLTTPPGHVPHVEQPRADRPQHLGGDPARDRRDVRDRHGGDRPLDRRDPVLRGRLRGRGDAPPLRDERPDDQRRVPARRVSRSRWGSSCASPQAPSGGSSTGR